MQVIKHAHERNARIVVSLLKQHGVKNIIVSPGSTNLPVVVSVQHDPYFMFIHAWMNVLQLIWHVAWQRQPGSLSR